MAKSQVFPCPCPVGARLLRVSSVVPPFACPHRLNPPPTKRPTGKHRSRRRARCPTPCISPPATLLFPGSPPFDLYAPCLLPTDVICLRPCFAGLRSRTLPLRSTFGFVSIRLQRTNASRLSKIRGTRPPPGVPSYVPFYEFMLRSCLPWP